MTPDSALCAWCCTKQEVTRDHVFPRAFGGTLEAEIWVPACRQCQTTLSAYEGELARSSPLALARLVWGPGPRHRERATSGLVRPRLAFVKQPGSCRYTNFSFRAGDRSPRVLPALELDPKTHVAYFHADTLEDLARLYQALRDLIEPPTPANPTTQSGIHVEFLTGTFREIADDPDFHPRVLLSETGRLHACARSLDEAHSLIRLIAIARCNGAFEPQNVPATLPVDEVPAGTPHSFHFDWDHDAAKRIALKVACGILVAGYRRMGTMYILPPTVRNAIVASGPLDDIQLEQRSELENVMEPEHALLAGLVILEKAALRAVVTFYDWTWLVSFPDPTLAAGTATFGATCMISNNRQQRWLTEAEVLAVARLSGLVA